MTTESPVQSHNVEPDEAASRLYRLIDTERVDTMRGGVLPVDGAALAAALDQGTKELLYYKPFKPLHGAFVEYRQLPDSERGAVDLPRGRVEFIRIGDLLMLPVTPSEDRMVPASVDTAAQHSALSIWVGTITGGPLSQPQITQVEAMVMAMKDRLVLTSVPRDAAEFAPQALHPAGKEQPEHVLSPSSADTGQHTDFARNLYALDQVPYIEAAIERIAQLPPDHLGW